jgi:threonine/homoserine/homoserine lactone efflux protein
MLALFLLVAGTHFTALLSPGPDFFLLLRTALLEGRQQATGCAAGIALANLLSMSLVLLALQLLPVDGGWAWRVLQGLGGAYFAWLGIQALHSSRQLQLDEPLVTGAGRRLRGVWQGLLASSLNPKLPIFYAGLFGVLREAAMPAWGLILAVLWMTLVVLVWDLALVHLLGRPGWRAWLQHRVVLLDRLCGGLLLVLGAWLLGSLLR